MIDTPPLEAARLARAAAALELRPVVSYFAEVDSTNLLAAQPGPGSCVVVVTDHQRAGRGRRSRAWVAPPRTSILLSIALDLPTGVPPSDGPMLGALAVADAVRSACGVSAELKWPNDVLVRGRKLAGILAEYATRRGRRRLTLGMGINGNFDPADVGIEGATSLQVETGRDVDREEVAISLLKFLDLWYCSLTQNPDACFHAWSSRLETIGRRLTVVDDQGAWDGQAIGVIRTGALQVIRDREVHTVYAADVSVRTNRGEQ